MPGAAASLSPCRTSGGTFAERAAQLVAFLVERHAATDSARQREQELGEWIAHRQQAQRHGWMAAHHFVAEELGIILRALRGPAAVASHTDLPARQQLCWLIARCMSHEE
jgi:hypothetical protein